MNKQRPLSRTLLRLKPLLIFTVLIATGCNGDFCIGERLCVGDELEVIERTLNQSDGEYTISGEIDGDTISHTFAMSERLEIEALSFGIGNAWSFRRYGGQRTIDVLEDHALETYREDYLEPGIGCPAWFMNKNLKSVILIAADDLVASDLDQFDLPFHGEGTEFSLGGHYLEHLSDRYIENGNPINLKIHDYIRISSNVGSARRKVEYFLVTDL